MSRTRASRRSRPLGGFRGRALILALAVPLIAVPAAAYVLVPGESGARVPLAPAATAGSFHPVAGGFEPDSTGLAGCEGRYSCLEQAFGNIAYREGPRRALTLFEARIESDRDVERDCHRIVHTIGSAVFARFQGNVAKTFAKGTATCASGYYHGILERAFVGITSKVGLARVARKLCVGQGIRRRSFLDYQCRHGLGHGLMIQTGYDLPTALAICSRLGTGWDEVTCTSGAFMENVSTRFGYRSRWLDEDDPLYPCTRVPLRHRRSCYVRATTWVLQLNGNDFEQAASTCRSAGRPWVTFCFRGFGRDAVVEARYSSGKRVQELCALARSARGECLYGAARTFGDGAGLEGARRAASFCRRVSGPERDDCVSGLGIVVGLLYPTDAGRGAACGRLAAGNARACLRAARAEVDPSGRRSWG